jgi:pimeloyl-ACP methyl ester carboxylesterase
MFGDRDAKRARFWRQHYVGTEPSPLRLRFDRQFLTGNKYMRIPLRDRMPRALRKKRLAQLTMPVLVVVADQDICQDGPATAAKVEKVLPAARVELVSPSGHFVTFDCAREVGTMLSDFLAATSASGGASRMA